MFASETVCALNITRRSITTGITHLQRSLFAMGVRATSRHTTCKKPKGEYQKKTKEKTDGIGAEEKAMLPQVPVNTKEKINKATKR
jgi:hypothetical protein